MKKRTTPPRECSIESCTRTAKYAGTGWCQAHYHRWWRTGDPLGVKQEYGASGSDAVSWKGDDITYRAAHTRVVTTKGNATQHDCVRCDRRADQWSYDHADPAARTEIIDGRPVLYSPDIDHYQPMCRSCHVKMDRGEYGNGWARKTHCVNGHAFDDLNTLVKRNGERACRACARDRMAAKRTALRARGLSSRGKEFT